MDSHEGNEAVRRRKWSESLPPPPPVPANVVPLKVETEQVPESPAKKKVVCVPIARRGFGSKGNKNHYKVDVCNVNGDFSIIPSRFFMKMVARDGKGVGRKVIDTVHETYDTELAGKDFAYDGEKSLFTLGPLPRNKLEFRVVLEDVMSNMYGITVVEALEA